MAFPGQVETLRRSVQEWNERRKGRLSPAQLHGAALQYAHLSGANLAQATLVDADLVGAKLNGANLEGANLDGAKLVVAGLGGANLRGATLRGANLYKASLTNARLDRARLDDAILVRANLDGASLEGTIFIRANLSSASFEGAHWSGATLGRTNFGDCDLRAVGSGARSPSHVGPSTIGIDSLYRSKGEIPEEFLRGAGVEEHLIDLQRSLAAPTAIDFYSCFISYSHVDRSFARRLHDQLQGRGIRCWLDEHQLLPGDDIYDEVDRGIKFWDKILLCCSEASLTSWWVESEIKASFEKEQRLQKEREGEKVLALVPLNLDGYFHSGEWRSGLRHRVKDRLAADFQGWEHDNAKFEAQFERVVQALKYHAEQPPPPSFL